MTSSHVEFLKALTEDELSELVLIPLFQAMGYQDIRYTHGILEYGKDIVFAASDPLEGNRFLCATVKQRPLTGSVSSSKGIHEVLFQVQQALTEPFVDPLRGRAVSLDRVFVITSHEISQPAIRSISGQLQQLTNRVQFIDGARLASLLMQFLPSLLNSLANAESRYLNTLLKRFVAEPLLGAMAGDHSLAIEDLYTPASLARIEADEARYLSFMSPPTTHLMVSQPELLTTYRFAVVLADVGTGKTTLLRRLAIDLLQSNTESPPRRPHVFPLLVSLAQIGEDSLDVYDRFVEALGRSLAGDGAVNALEKNREGMLLLLDGFDELRRSHDTVANHIQRLGRDWPGGVIVTSRPSRPPSLQPPFQYIRLNPFDDVAVEAFLTKWFGRSDDRIQALMTRIKGQAILQSLCRTPLMLTLYAALGTTRSVDSLPTRRTDIFDLIVTMLLGEWDSRRGVTNHFSPALKLRVLEAVAFAAHHARTKRFSMQAVTKVIEDVIAGDAQLRSADKSADAIFAELLFRSSMIRSAASEEFEFVHLSFQEFLCAKRFVRLGDAKTLSSFWYDEWWRGVVTFYFGLTRYIAAIPVRGRARRGWGLAMMEAMAEADFSDAVVRAEVAEMVRQDLLEGPDLNQGERDACQRIGDELVEVLKGLAERQHNKPRAQQVVSMHRFFQALFAVDSEASKALLFASSDFVDTLSFRDSIALATGCVRYAASTAGGQFLTTLLKRIDERLHHGLNVRALTRVEALGLTEALGALFVGVDTACSSKDVSRLWRAKAQKAVAEIREAIARGGGLRDRADRAT